MNLKFLLLLVLLLVGWWYFRPPSAVDIADHTVIDVKGGTIIHREQLYHAQWGQEVTYRGLVRYTGRAFHESPPSSQTTR